MEERGLDLIKNLIVTRDEHKPFHDDFNRDQFIERCEEIGKEVSFQEREFEFIEATITLNNFYEGLLEQIEEDIAHIDLSSSELIYQVIGVMNFNYCQFTSEAKKKYEESFFTTPHSLDHYCYYYRYFLFCYFFLFKLSTIVDKSCR